MTSIVKDDPSRKWHIDRSYRRRDDQFDLFVFIDPDRPSSWFWRVKDITDPGRKAVGRAATSDEAMRKADKALSKLRSAAIILKPRVPA
jgi:hypothetical protein